MGQVQLVGWGARRYEVKEDSACLEWCIGGLGGEEEMKSVQAGTSDLKQ